MPDDGPGEYGDHRPDLTDEIEAIADTLREIKATMADQQFKTQSRFVRGLEALDHREERRQSSAQSSLEAAIGGVVSRIDELRHEMRLIDKSARRQIEDLSGRMYSSLDGIIEILGYLKSEIAAIHYSNDASRSEARMHSESGRNAGEELV